MLKITAKGIIKELENEIRMRKEVYPKMVSRKKMSPAEADYKIKCIERVLETMVSIQNAFVLVKNQKIEINISIQHDRVFGSSMNSGKVRLAHSEGMHISKVLDDICSDTVEKL